MSRVKMLEIGQPCRKCGTPVVKRAPKKKKASSAYHYHYYLWCPSCHAMYMLESQKYLSSSVSSLLRAAKETVARRKETRKGNLAEIFPD